jgi:UDP-N-acetylmuramoyl-L-alanyl-D-glutamate--2,6-diaminopimelate ligase
MQLATAIARLEDASVVGDAQVDIAAVHYDSRRVEPGSLFCCVVGREVDGHRFAGPAVERGAVALLVEHRLALDVAQVVVPDVRRAMARVAATFHGDPSTAMTVIGVTGTNGKTTTVQLLANVFAAAGRRIEVLGTLTGARTTPEAPDLQAMMARWRDTGTDAVAMEVSSHALELHRVDATRFAVAVFTNLSRDHLDFHRTMESYFEAKAMLFRAELAEQAVVNLDSPYGRLLADSATIPTIGYRVADLDDVEVGMGASRFRWRGHLVELHLGGSFNVANALAAAEAAVAAGLDAAAVAEGLSAPIAVPGRFEVIASDLPFTVLVDYAHTPDGLEQLLASARALAGEGQVTVVFGAGGDRDRAKRPAMGEVAARLADRVVLTADNSRGETTGAIIEAVREGFDRVSPRHAHDLVIEPDRRSAIALAIRRADAGDVVIIAGKGHETTQTIGDEVTPFDDRVVARELLEQRAEAAP